MKKKIIAIIVACVLLAGVVTLIGLEFKERKAELSATAEMDYIAPFKTPGPTRAPLVRGIPTRKP